jgi:hypothetical protein
MRQALFSSASHNHAVSTQRPCWYVLRREPYYHKLQYSKTPKYDPMAAFLGAAIGALVSYLALGSFGTGGSDLSDLSVLVWYSAVWLFILKFFIKIFSYAFSSGLGFVYVWCHVFIFFCQLVLSTIVWFFYVIGRCLGGLCVSLRRLFFNVSRVY